YIATIGASHPASRDPEASCAYTCSAYIPIIAAGATTQNGAVRPSPNPTAVAAASATALTASNHHQPPPAYVATGATTAVPAATSTSRPSQQPMVTPAQARTDGCHRGRGVEASNSPIRRRRSRPPCQTPSATAAGARSSVLNRTAAANPILRPAHEDASATSNDAPSARVATAATPAVLRRSSVRSTCRVAPDPARRAALTPALLRGRRAGWRYTRARSARPRPWCLGRPRSVPPAYRGTPPGPGPAGSRARRPRSRPRPGG